MWFKPREQRWTRSEETPAPAVPAIGDAEVVLLDAGERKIGVIKTIREYTGLGLADAKDLSEKPGASLGSYAPAVAEAFVNALSGNGARAEVRGGAAPEPDETELVDDLERLAELHRTGVLTDAEFAAAKQRLLS